MLVSGHMHEYITEYLIPFSLCAVILHCTITLTQGGREGSVRARAVQEASLRASLGGQEGKGRSEPSVEAVLITT